jgi:hypothetical protein
MSDRPKTATSSNKSAAAQAPTVDSSGHVGLHKSARLKTATSSNKSATSLKELDEDLDEEEEEGSASQSESELPETAKAVENRVPRAQPLSEYEITRQTNILRNKALLKEIEDAHGDLMMDINSRSSAKTKTVRRFRMA